MPSQFIPYPAYPVGQEGNYIKTSNFLSISTFSNHQSEAAKFVDFMINDVEANKILLGDRGVTILNKVREQIMPSMKENEKLQYEYIESIEKATKPVDPPLPLTEAKVQSLFSRLQTKVLNGEWSPEAAAKSFREEATKIVSDGTK